MALATSCAAELLDVLLGDEAAFAVPDVELVVVPEVEDVGVVVGLVVGVVVVPIVLDVVGVVFAEFVLVPVGMALNQSTVILVPPILAVLLPATTVLVVELLLALAIAGSNSVYSGKVVPGVWFLATPNWAGETFRYFLTSALGHPLIGRQRALQGDEITLRRRSQEEAVGRSTLPIGHVVSIRRWEQDPAQHLELVDRDRAVELAVGRVVEEVEPPLLGGRIVGVLVEDFIVDSGLDGTVSRRAAQECGHRSGFGHPVGRGRVDEVLHFLRGDDLVVVDVDVDPSRCAP